MPHVARSWRTVLNPPVAVVYELAWHGSAALRDQWQADTALDALLALRGLTALDLYRPARAPAQDPFVDDGPGPLAIAMLEFAGIEALRAALGGEAPFLRPAIELAGGDRITLTGAAMRRVLHPVPGETHPRPLGTPFSYVVRYYLPADDPAASQRWYLANLPPLQASLPGIRGISCYLPLAERTGGPPSPGYLLGNEVAFDDVAAFNLAMASEARQALRRRSKHLPPFSGRSTHYPMDRTRLLG